VEPVPGLSAVDPLSYDSAPKDVVRFTGT